MTPRVATACALLIALGIACSSRANVTRMDAFEARGQSFDTELEEVEVRVRALGTAWARVARDYETVATTFREARAAHERARVHSEAASAELAAAAERWRVAQAQWALVRAIVFAAVAMDRGTFGRDRGWGEFSCDRMTTAAFRRLLAARGMSLVGLDVDHIVPRSLGGADHPANYQLLPSSTNRSLGNRWGIDKCLTADRDRCGEAVAVSHRCGTYRGPLY